MKLSNLLLVYRNYLIHIFVYLKIFIYGFFLENTLYIQFYAMFGAFHVLMNIAGLGVYDFVLINRVKNKEYLINKKIILFVILFQLIVAVIYLLASNKFNLLFLFFYIVFFLHNYFLRFYRIEKNISKYYNLVLLKGFIDLFLISFMLFIEFNITVLVSIEIFSSAIIILTILYKTRSSKLALKKIDTKTLFFSSKDFYFNQIFTTTNANIFRILMNFNLNYDPLKIVIVDIVIQFIRSINVFQYNNLYSKTPILRNGFYLNIIFVLLLLAFIYVQDLPIILISLSLIIISHMTYLAEYIEKVRFQAFSSLIAFALTILFVIVFSIDDIYKIISLNVTLIYITLFLQLYYFEKKHTNYYWK